MAPQKKFTVFTQLSGLYIVIEFRLLGEVITT